MKTVDILLATYNGEKYITEQIESILNQTYKDFRLLNVSQNSYDAILDKAFGFDNFKWQQENKVKISENYIFVLSAIDGVFQFDRKGHFVKKISSKGNGLGEWNIVIDIAVDESNDKIYIYDYTGKLMCFSIATGEYSGQFMVPGKMFSKVDIKDDKFLIAPYNSMGDKESMVYCLDLSNSNIIETGELAQFVLTDYSKMLYSFTKGIVPNDGAVLLHPNLSDTVYEYIPGHNYVTQKFAVSFNNPLTPQLRSMGYDGLQKAQTIKDIAQNEHYLR